MAVQASWTLVSCERLLARFVGGVAPTRDDVGWPHIHRLERLRPGDKLKAHTYSTIAECLPPLHPRMAAMTRVKV